MELYLCKVKKLDMSIKNPVIRKSSLIRHTYVHEHNGLLIFTFLKMSQSLFYWYRNNQSGGFSEEGIMISSRTNEMIECVSNHLTSFAILVNTQTVSISY